MRGIFPTLLATGFGLFVLFLIWRLLTKAGRARVASISNEQIDKSAKELIDKHGDDAAAACEALVAKSLAAGDFDGEAVWRRVEKALKRLQAD